MIEIGRLYCSALDNVLEIVYYFTVSANHSTLNGLASEVEHHITSGWRTSVQAKRLCMSALEPATLVRRSKVEPLCDWEVHHGISMSANYHMDVTVDTRTISFIGFLFIMVSGRFSHAAAVLELSLHEFSGAGNPVPCRIDANLFGQDQRGCAKHKILRVVTSTAWIKQGRQTHARR